MSNILYAHKVNQLIENVREHNAWFEQINSKEAEELLISHPCHSYLLRKGTSDLHYFISYVTKDSQVSHQSIRISAELKGWYSNGGVGCVPTTIYNELEPLILETLKCEESDLLPLSNELIQAQGF